MDDSVLHDGPNAKPDISTQRRALCSLAQEAAFMHLGNLCISASISLKAHKYPWMWIVRDKCLQCHLFNEN
jgi:hypothetical protein